MKKKLFIIVPLMIIIAIGYLVADKTIYVQKDKSGTYTTYFPYGATETDTSRNLDISGTKQLWLDVYSKLASSTTFTLSGKVLAQYTQGGPWLAFHDLSTIQSAITSSGYARVMLRNLDSCAIPPMNCKIALTGTVTGDSACTWLVLSGY